MDSLCLTSRCADAIGPGVFSGYLTALCLVPMFEPSSVGGCVWSERLGCV